MYFNILTPTFMLFISYRLKHFYLMGSFVLICSKIIYFRELVIYDCKKNTKRSEHII